MNAIINKSATRSNSKVILKPTAKILVKSKKRWITFENNDPFAEEFYMPL
jgi:hypothetical protein